MKKTLLTLLALIATVCCVVGLTACADKTVHVTEVTLSETTLTLTEGSSTTLHATVAPEDATDKTVTWDSSDKEVATVSGGAVSAVKEGKATITVTTKDGEKKATCEVTVIAAEDPVPELGSAKENPYLVTIGDERAVSGKLDLEKTYWFKFTLEEATELEISFGYFPGESGNSYIDETSYELLDAEGNSLASDTADTLAIASLQQELEAGTYYFTVTAKVGKDAQYTVVFEKVVEVIEPGSTKDAAVEAELGKEYEKAFVGDYEYWYTFKLDEAAIVKATVSRTNNTQSTITFILYEGDEILASQSASYSGSSTLTIQQSLKANTEYHLKLLGYGSITATLKLETVEVGSAKDVAKEVELDYAGSLNLGAGKDYWFVFEIDVPSTVTLDLGAAENIAHIFDGASSTEGLTATYLTAGTYYLKLTNNGSAEAALNLTLSREDVQEMPEGSSKDKPFNVAVSITEYVSAEEITDTDEHWFRLTLTEARTVTLKSSTQNNSYIEIKFVLYDSEDQVIAQTSADYDDGNFNVTQSLAEGVYFLKVVRIPTTSNNPYKVHVQAAPNGSSKAEAISASVGSHYELTAKTYWFKLSPSSDGKVIIYSTGENNVEAELQNASGSSVSGAISSKNGTNFRIECELSSTEMYYLQVTTADNAPSFTVCFAIPGSSKEAAETAVIGEEYSKVTEKSNKYFFTFTPEETGEIEITVKCSNYNYPTFYAVLYCPDVDPEQKSAQGSGTITFKKEFEKDETYYLEVWVSTYYGTSTLTVKLEEVEDTSGGGGNDNTENVGDMVITVNKVIDINSLPSMPGNNKFDDGPAEVWLKLQREDSSTKVFIRGFTLGWAQLSADVIKFTVYNSQGEKIAETSDANVVEITAQPGATYVKVTYSGTDGYMIGLYAVDPFAD